MSKTAVLVVGPESSGTRLLTSVFIAAGCDGDSTHGQRFDHQPPTADKIVWRRSFPHGDRWPNAVQIIQRLTKWEYKVRVAVMVRDWHCTARSQVERRHAATVRRAIRSIREAYQRIFATLSHTGAWYVVVSYESLIHRPRPALEGLMPMFGLPIPELDIHDANEKHYGVNRQQAMPCE